MSAQNVLKIFNLISEIAKTINSGAELDLLRWSILHKHA